jgi:hypothetical protein
MTVVFILEHLAPSIAGVPLIALSNQVYGMPVLIHYTCLPANILLDMSDGLRREREGKVTIERTDQLENYAEAIGKLIVKEYPELGCLGELEDMAKEYQFILERVKNSENKFKEKLKP